MEYAFSIEHLTLALDIGERLLVCGAEVSRVEDTITRICRAYGLNGPVNERGDG